MSNPFQTLFDEGKEIIMVGFFVFIALIFFSALGSISGTQPEARVVVEQGQEAISYLWVLYLGLPSVGIIFLIIWLVKKAKDTSVQL